MRRCPATSAYAAHASASAQASSRRPRLWPRRIRGPEMLFDRIDEHAVDRTTGGSGAPVSRRTFLMAGAAVGGGLLIGVGFGAAATAPAKAADAAGSPAFSPNAFVRIDPDGQVTVTM